MVILTRIFQVAKLCLQSWYGIGLLLGLAMWASEILNAPASIKQLPVRIFDVPFLIPSPGIWEFTWIMGGMGFWMTDRYYEITNKHPGKKRRIWAKHDFFNCICTAVKIEKDILLTLGGVATVSSVCSLTSHSALVATAWLLLLIIQRALIWLFLVTLEKSTRYQEHVALG